MAKSGAKQRKKMLGVQYEDGIPTFFFSGEWTGRDIGLVQSLLMRKYRQYQRKRKLDELQLLKEDENG